VKVKAIRVMNAAKTVVVAAIRYRMFCAVHVKVKVAGTWKPIT